MNVLIMDDGSTVTPPQGGPQPGEIAIRNTRAAGSDNPTQYEWADYYAVNNHANVILANVDNVQGASDSQKDAQCTLKIYINTNRVHVKSMRCIFVSSGMTADRPPLLWLFFLGRADGCRMEMC